MTSFDQDIARLGDGRSETNTQALPKHRQVRGNGQDDIYLDFWPIGCGGPTQTPNWALFHRKLGRLAKSNDRISQCFLHPSAREWNTIIKNTKVLDDFIPLPRKCTEEPSASVFELEETRTASAEGLLLPAFHLAVDPTGDDLATDKHEAAAGLDPEGRALLKSSQIVSTGDESRAYVADKLRKMDLHPGSREQPSLGTRHSSLDLAAYNTADSFTKRWLPGTDVAYSWPPPPSSIRDKRVQFDIDAMQAPEDGPDYSLHSRASRGVRIMQIRGTEKVRDESEMLETAPWSWQEIGARIQNFAELQEPGGTDEAGGSSLEAAQVTSSGALEGENKAEGDIWRQRCLRLNSTGQQHPQTQPVDGGDSVGEGGKSQRRDAKKEEAEERHAGDERRRGVSTFLRKLTPRSRRG